MALIVEQLHALCDAAAAQALAVAAAGSGEASAPEGSGGSTSGGPDAGVAGMAALENACSLLEDCENLVTCSAENK